MKIYLNYAEGFGAYEKIVGRVTSHPALIIHDETKGKFYIFNLTSNDQSLKNNVNYCFSTPRGQRLEVYANNVYVKGKYYAKYAMNLTSTCAVVDEQYVSWIKNIKPSAYITIDSKYKCSNFRELTLDCLNLIYDYTHEIICYNGNVDFGGEIVENNKFKDVFLPQDVFEYIENIVDPCED